MGAAQSDQKPVQSKLPMALQTKEQREATRLQYANNFKLKLEKERAEKREKQSVYGITDYGDMYVLSPLKTPRTPQPIGVLSGDKFEWPLYATVRCLQKPLGHIWEYLTTVKLDRTFRHELVRGKHSFELPRMGRAHTLKSELADKSKKNAEEFVSQLNWAELTSDIKEKLYEVDYGHSSGHRKHATRFEVWRKERMRSDQMGRENKLEANAFFHTPEFTAQFIVDEMKALFLADARRIVEAQKAKKEF